MAKTAAPFNSYKTLKGNLQVTMKGTRSLFDDLMNAADFDLDANPEEIISKVKSNDLIMVESVPIRSLKELYKHLATEVNGKKPEGVIFEHNGKTYQFIANDRAKVAAIMVDVAADEQLDQLVGSQYVTRLGQVKAIPQSLAELVKDWDL
jgi:hypothetical protein